MNEDGRPNMEPISRADVAQVCVQALLDPNALNKSFYVSKAKSVKVGPIGRDGLSSQFAVLLTDLVA
jgi:hypothetical protein